jgi:acetyltransferase
VLRADTIEELFDVARALDRCPLPHGDRVAIVTNAGGPAIMATDACVNSGLPMAELSAETRRALESFLPAEASVANPVDMIASATAESYARATTAVLRDSGVDLVLVINVTPLLSDPRDIMAAVGRATREAGRDKPVLAVMMATDDFYEELKGQSGLPPVYRFPESAVRAMALLCRYARWRRLPVDAAPPELPVDDGAVAEVLAGTAPDAEGYLPPDAVLRVLAAYGIPTARYRLAGEPAEAAAAASELGFPVALKAVAPGLVHKSDVGAVAVGLEDARAVEWEAARMVEAVRAAGHRVEGFLVQEVVRGGHEVIFGITTDPRFGPLLMFGMGGKYVEVLKDVRFGVTPLSPLEAQEMIRGIRAFPLLKGVRGEPPADLELLTEVLLRLTQLAQRHRSIEELDINPFLAAADRSTAKALDARIRVRRPETAAP